ncbi:hypothetical protein PanWU01x14_315580, partial [Parasponia andersonii]
MKKNKKAKEAKYTVYGFSIALQYWAYEAIPKLTGTFSENLGIKFPRVLSWTSNKIPSMIDCIDVFKIKKLVTKALLNLREAEKEFYEHIYHDPHHSLGSTGVEEEGIDVEDEDENKKEAAEAKRAAEEAGIFDAPTNKANHTELKANQVIVNDKLNRLLKMMEEIKVHRQPTGFESEATQSDVLPEGYQPGEDVVIRTPTKEHTPEEQQTLGVKELQLAEVATVKFGRKMLPYFVLNVEGVADRDDLDLTTMTKPCDFDVR